jgi:hypothetical protein
MISSSPEKQSVSILLRNLRLQQNPRPPVNIEALAKLVGAEIACEQMFCDGSVEEIGKNKYLIRVNENSNKLRQRFTIAHEIAHLILKLSSRSELISSFEKSFRQGYGPSIDWSDQERICDTIAASLLVPANVSKRCTDWMSFSVRKIEKISREWQVSLDTMLWSIFTVSPSDGGFMWYSLNNENNDPADLKMDLCWKQFPKSRGIRIPDTVWLRTSSTKGSSYSMVDLTNNEERFHPKIKFEFEGLSEYRAVRTKAFGKGKKKKILFVVYPKNVNSGPTGPTKSLQRTIF